MNWIFFALLSPLIFTTVFFVDKYVLEKEVPDYRGMPIYFGIVGTTYGSILWLALGMPILPARDAGLLILIGVTAVITSVFYFRAMNANDASTVIVLLQVQPLLVLILSFIFLDEVISQLQLVGFFLILGASLGMTITRHGTDYQFSMGTFLTVMTLNLGISSTAVLYKFVVEDHRFLDTVAYEAIGNGLGGIMLFVFSGAIRRAFLTTLRVMRRRALGIIFLNEGFVQLAKSTGLRAVSLGPVALVRVIGSTQVFTGILIGWLLTVMVSSVYHEDISQQNLTRKLGLATVMFGGVVLLIT
jgi:uncharacterized membrane protein